MITTTLSASNEFTQSVASAVPCYLLSSGDDISRQIDLPASWNAVRLTFKYSVVGGDINSVGLFFAGMCSGAARSRNKTGAQHCIGFSSRNNINPITTPGFSWDPLSSPDTVPSNDVYGWVTTYSANSIITGSNISLASFNGHFFCRYETVWNPASASHFPNQSLYPWHPMSIEIEKPGYTWNNAPGATNYGVMYQAWGITAGTYTANIPKGAFHQNNQKNSLYQGNIPGIYEGASAEWGVTKVNGGGTQLSTNFAPINEAIFGALDSINFFWTGSLTTKLAIRDISVMALDYGQL